MKQKLIYNPPLKKAIRTRSVPFQMIPLSMQSYQENKKVIHDRLFSYITKLGLLCMFMLFGVNVLMGQTFTGTYSFASATGNVASLSYNGSAITNLTVGSLVKTGVTSSSSTGNSRATGFGTGSTNGGAAGGSIDLGKYYEFTITAGSGYTISNPTLTFGVGRSGTGPRRFEWRWNVDAYGSALSVGTVNGSITHTSGVLETPDANAGYIGNVITTSTSGQTTITFRFYPYGAESAAGTGGLQGDLTFGGTLVSSASSSSNIIANTSFTYPTNIAYASNQAASGLTTGNSLEIAQFDIQDGGGSADADAVGTILNAISFNITNPASLRALAIFDGSTNLGEITTVGATASFSGLTLTAADDASKTFSVRATYNDAVTDNEQYSLTVNSTTTDAAGSSFAVSNAGAASTSTTGDDNRIEVTATELIFDQNPSSTLANTVMSPSPSIVAMDNLANTDLDFNASISLSTTGTFDAGATTTMNAVNGVAVFTNIIHSVAGVSLTLEGTSTGLTSTGNSTTFNITSSPLPVITSSLTATETYGTAFTYTITATNSPSSYSATGLPSGLSVNTSNGEITGTPSSVGTYTISIAATNAGGTANDDLVLTITPKELTVSGAIADTKEYDGTTTATITGSTLVGILGADVVTVSNSGTFINKAVGTSKVVTSTQTLAGADAGNYTLTIPTGLTADITPKELTITSPVAQNKAFDGTTAATITGTLSGIFSPDVVTLVGTGTFASSAIGTGISVTSTSTLAGADANNYTLAQPTGLTADITVGQTTLAVGDIAILGFNSNTPDNFSFVTWVDINDGTYIKFTDNGFLSNGSANLSLNVRGGENFVIWRNNTGNIISAGTVITIENPSTTNLGTIVSGNLSGLVSGGDQIFAYQGIATSGTNPDFTSNSNPTTFNGTILFGLNFASNWLTSGTPTTSLSYLPSELNTPLGNIALAVSSPNRGQYTGPRNCHSFDDYKFFVTNPSNWSTASGTGVITLDATSFSTSSSSDLALSATSNTLSTVGSATSTIAIADGSMVNFKEDASCNILASITDAASGNVLGSTTVDLEVTSALPTNNSLQQYAPRVYSVTPTSGGSATATLYYTQGDFSTYNTLKGGFYLPMPTSGNNSDPNIANLFVAQLVGGINGTFTELTPSVNWNATTNVWEVTISPSTLGGNYYVFTKTTCNLMVDYASLSTSAITLNSATATWNSVVGVYNNTYKIRIKPVSGSAWNGQTITGTTHNFSGLMPATQYEYQVRAACSATEEGAYSASQFFTTLGSACPMVTGLTNGVITPTSGGVTWTSNGATSYNVRIRQIGNAWAGHNSTTGNTYTFNYLSPGTDYEYQVRPVCSGVYGTWSAAEPLTTTALPVCATPTGLTTVSTTLVAGNVSWTGTGATSYNVRVRVANTTWAGHNSAMGTTYTFGNLQAGTDYEYQVRSVCGTAYGTWSAVGTFTTTANVCPTAMGLQFVSATPTTANVTWTGNGSTGYNVRVRVVGAPWAGHNSTANTNYTFTGLSATTNYEYQVRSICGESYAAWSTAGTFTTGGSVLGSSTENGISELANSINIYPNPTSDELNISFEVETESIANVKVLDMSGRVVKQLQMSTEKGLNHAQLSLGDLTSGIYTVQILHDNQLLHVSRVNKQ